VPRRVECSLGGYLGTVERTGPTQRPWIHVVLHWRRWALRRAALESVTTVTLVTTRLRRGAPGDDSESGGRHTARHERPWGQRDGGGDEPAHAASPWRAPPGGPGDEGDERDDPGAHV
jgi:hypothetical protein